MKRKTKMAMGFRNSSFCAAFSAFLLLLSIFTQKSESRALVEAGDDVDAILGGNEASEEERNKSERHEYGGGCNIYENNPIHVLMDRICELCHDMFSYQQPNTRAECRSDCFRSNSFKKCLRLFKPPPNPQKRRDNRSLPPFLME